jgi:sulfatase maturation enzyme AslB (radical SAM superfamily)
VALGFDHLYFTGGEPLILDEIYAMLAYASTCLPTTLLTNAMLIKNARLERLLNVQHPNLIIQVSLDGGQAEHHDAYRGAGSWAKTVAGLETLLAHDFQVRLSTTETPANCAHLDEICQFHTTLGIPEEHHFIRPLAKRGFASEGLEVSQANLVPELTVNREGVFWHPLTTEADMLVSDSLFPLAAAVEQVQDLMDSQVEQDPTAAQTFT